MGRGELVTALAAVSKGAVRADRETDRPTGGVMRGRTEAECGVSRTWSGKSRDAIGRDVDVDVECSVWVRVRVRVRVCSV